MPGHCRLCRLNQRIVYDRNQVSVSGTETKVHFRYRYQRRFFFSETETSDFSHVSDFVWGYKFL